jgi:hypothetical protein
MSLARAIASLISARSSREKRVVGVGEQQQSGGRSRSLEPSRTKVRLRELPAGLPVSEVQRLTMDILKKEREVDFSRLLPEVASKIYLDEVHRAAAVDIGLLGPGLFLSEIAREIRGRDGELWEIICGPGCSE